MSGTLVKTLKGTRNVSTEAGGVLADTITGVVRGVSEVGVAMGETAKSAVIGVLRGMKETGVEAMDMVATTASTLVQGRQGRCPGAVQKEQVIRRSFCGC